MPAHPRRLPGSATIRRRIRVPTLLLSSSERAEMNTSTLLGVEFRPITIPESIHSRDATRLHLDGRGAQSRLPRDPRKRRQLRLRRRAAPALPAGQLRTAMPVARRPRRRAGRPRRRRPSPRGRIEGRLLADRAARRRSRSGSRDCRVRARRADGACARPHRAAVLGRASRRRRCRDRLPHRLRFDPRGPSRTLLPQRTATRSNRWSASARSTSEPRPTRLEELLADARTAAAGYRVVQWSPPTPDEFVDGYAWMKSRMSTDAPAGALEFDEETWDAARLARHDSTYTDGGRLMLVTAAQHIETGALCAFNELVIGPDRTAASHQEDTLVLKEHRGHRLGMLVKCAGPADLARARPRVAAHHHLQRRGEPSDARHQRGDRLRPDRLRRSLEEGAR